MQSLINDRWGERKRQRPLAPRLPLCTILLLAAAAAATGAAADPPAADPTSAPAGTPAAFLGPPTFRYEERIPLSREQHAQAVSAVNHIYNFEFEAALSEAKAIDAVDPKSPLGDLLLAEAYWWQAINNLDRPEFVTEFRKHANAGIAASEKLLERDDRDPFALFALGGLNGRKAILDGLTGKRLESVNTAVTARKYLRLLNRYHPDMEDAYFGLGVYDYFAAELPWFARLLSRFLLGLAGDKERGLAEMERAARGGLFTQVDSRVFLAIAYLDTEGRYDEALAILRGLHDTYPRNLDFYGMLGFAYRTEKDWDNAIAILEEMVAKAKTEPVLGRQSRDMTTYFLANTYKVAGLFDRAAPLLDEVVTDPNPATQWLTATALIERGRVHDAEGRRMAAINDYQRVLTLKDFRGSHDKARSHISTAYVVPAEERSHYVKAGGASGADSGEGGTGRPATPAGGENRASDLR